MARIEVSVETESAPGHVWSALADLGSHHRWMQDAESIRFASEQRCGVGTELLVPTRIGPLRTLDKIRVTEWIERSRIGVIHSGLVTGTGTLSVRPSDAGGAVVTWAEELDFPTFLGGPLAGAVARPIVGRVWAANLRRLKALVDRDPATSW